MDETHPHAAEEAEFARGPRLWDAGEGVCCAAFQLGACAHTEVPDETDVDEEPRPSRNYERELLDWF